MLNLQDLIDDAKCYSEVRRLRWPEGVRCPTCNSAKVTKRGKHNRQKERQRYECGDCQKQFDDLTDNDVQAMTSQLRNQAVQHSAPSFSQP